MKVLMSANDVDRSIKRIAYEILEKNDGIKDLIVVGIKEGGVKFARKIGEHLSEIENEEVKVYEIDITNYRDDVPKKNFRKNRIVPIDNMKVVLVDDVIFTGRSIRAAMDALFDLGRPSVIQLAVLVDRGHRQIPIRADFVGKNIPTSMNENVEVFIDEENSFVEIR